MSVINYDGTELSLVELTEYSFTVHIRSISLVLAVCPCLKTCDEMSLPFGQGLLYFSQFILLTRVLGPGSVGSGVSVCG